MPNYKKMYFRLFAATEAAIKIMIDAQRECEELYIDDAKPSVIFLSESSECQQTSTSKTQVLD